MKKEEINNNLGYKLYILLVGLYILIQPILDIYKNLVENKIEIFGISIIEMTNILIIGLIVLLTIYINRKKFNAKNILLINFLGMIYILYIVLHIKTILNFDKNLYPQNGINAFIEIYYIFRALIEPLLLILCVYINKFTKKAFYLIISLLTYMISGLIVVSNVFGFSLVAYSVDNKVIIDNIFGWFTYTDTYISPITSKGLFFSANQLSNLLVILLPVNFYNYINKKNILNFLIIPIQILSMIMIGTKTATIGCIGIIIGSLILTIIISLKNKVGIKYYLKNKTILYVTIILLVPIISYCPLFLRYRNEKLYVDNNVPSEPTTPPIIDEPTPEKNDKETPNEGDIPIIIEPKPITLENINCSNIKDKKEIEFLKNNYSYYIPAPQYKEVYTIENDPTFWCNAMKESKEYYVGNRELKTNIFARIFELNDSAWDEFFGLGYTLNMLNLETDYYMHYYQFGLMGMILFIGPYFLLFILSCINVLKKLKSKFNYENLFLIASVFCGLVSPHLSGHLFSNLFVSLPLSIITIMLYLLTNEDVK